MIYNCNEVYPLREHFIIFVTQYLRSTVADEKTCLFNEIQWDFIFKLAVKGA